jgi:hypothetical protein
MRTKILLPNGCSCSTPSVNPKNWKSCTKSALKKDWYISYRFYDPEFDKPKQVTIQGMNMYREVSERRCSTQIILDDELHSLKVLGFNPITKKYLIKEQKPLRLDPERLNEFTQSNDYSPKTHFLTLKRSAFGVMTIRKLLNAARLAPRLQESLQTQRV